MAEGNEARELAAGLLESGRIEVSLLDRGRPRAAALVDGALEPGPPSSRRRLLLRRPDVALVFLPQPIQILGGLMLRLLGVRIVLAPMAWLGEDFCLPPPGSAPPRP